MKVLIICPQWGYFGGREKYLIDFVHELSRRGQECVLVYGEQTQKPAITRGAALITKFNIPILSDVQTVLDEQYTKILNSILERESPDVIFLNDMRNIRLFETLLNYGKVTAMTHYGWLFCLRGVRIRYLSRKACYHKLGYRCLLHGCFIKKSEKRSIIRLRHNSLKKLQILSSLYQKIDIHLVPSQYMKNLFLQHGFRDEQVKVIKLFVDLPYSSNNFANKEEPNVLFLGRIDRYKGVDFLLRALCKLRVPFTCNIIGEGPYLSHCKKLAYRLRLGKKVQFLGWLPNAQTKPHIMAARLIVVPSIMPEAFGLVGLEAMAYGKPVVAFDTGGISDWLHDGKSGYLVTPKDTAALTNKIEDLLRNPELANTLGAEGKRVVETTFNRNAHFDQMLVMLMEASNRN